MVSNGVLSLTGIIGSTNGVSVAGGLLVGTGTVVGPVAVQPGGAIEAGSTNTIGSLQISNTLVLSGNTIVKINKGGGSTHDLFTGQTSITYGGTLTVTNLSGILTTSDTFTLFSPGASASKLCQHQRFTGGRPGLQLHQWRVKRGGGSGQQPDEHHVQPERQHVDVVVAAGPSGLGFAVADQQFERGPLNQLG